MPAEGQHRDQKQTGGGEIRRLAGVRNRAGEILQTGQRYAFRVRAAVYGICEGQQALVAQGRTNNGSPERSVWVDATVGHRSFPHRALQDRAGEGRESGNGQLGNRASEAHVQSGGAVGDSSRQEPDEGVKVLSILGDRFA
jgi:hypothetical protein